MTLAAGAGVTRLGAKGRLGSVLAPGAVPLVVYYAVLLVAPLGLLVAYSFWKASFFAVTRTLTLTNYARIVSSPLYLQILIKTLACSLAVAATVVAVGFCVAYAITFRFKIWGPRILVAVMASLLSSYVVRLYALTTILGTNGLLNQSLLSLGLIREPLGFLLYGYFAIFLTLCYVYLPMAVLPLYSGLQGIGRTLLEAASDLGAGPDGCSEPSPCPWPCAASGPPSRSASSWPRPITSPPSWAGASAAR